jgi:hypothetical protein
MYFFGQPVSSKNQSATLLPVGLEIISGLFCADWGHESNCPLLLKNEKRVGVRNDVIISKVFQFYKELYNRFKRNKIPKCAEL